MSKSIKLNNDTYLDSSGIVHKNKFLNNYIPVVLYNNENGTNNNFTLSDSSENYECLEFFYKNSDEHYNSCKITNPNNKVIYLISGYPDKQYHWHQMASLKKIVGKEVTTKDYGRWSDGVYYNDNSIYVTKVLGYKNLN